MLKQVFQAHGIPAIYLKGFKQSNALAAVTQAISSFPMQPVILTRVATGNDRSDTWVAELGATIKLFGHILVVLTSTELIACTRDVKTLICETENKWTKTGE